MDEIPSKPNKHRRYPENAPGSFYVEQGYCITCLLPEHEAPDLMGFQEDESGANEQSHCYFKKQPETIEELERAVMALRVCCCGALRYAGDDIAILEMMSKAGLESQCDTL